ncbi:hypothetical protein [Thermohalobacter berrensis]|uniref:hypothetical protein n=1 Tax=Thermohalobacter berrensis TaxID=99594 RepID=UPI0015FF1613|nr:hypothetical protein [Thermohalobacter berrensis]
MNKDKHVLPNTKDTFANRIRREAKEEKFDIPRKIIYGPNNEPLVNVNMEVSEELNLDK